VRVGSPDTENAAILCKSEYVGQGCSLLLEKGERGEGDANNVNKVKAIFPDTPCSWSGVLSYCRLLGGFVITLLF